MKRSRAPARVLRGVCTRVGSMWGLEINSAPPNGGGTQLGLGASGRPRAAPRCPVGLGARLVANAPKKCRSGCPRGAPPVARMRPSGAG
eukprot:15461949-Alexandrium_andersonii.AAC.1